MFRPLGSALSRYNPLFPLLPPVQKLLLRGLCVLLFSLRLCSLREIFLFSDFPVEDAFELVQRIDKSTYLSNI